MAIVPEWWSQYLELLGPGINPQIRDASGNLVVFDPEIPAGINPVQDAYVAADFSLPATLLESTANLVTAVGNTFPTAPVNTIIPSDPGIDASALGQAVAGLAAYAFQVFGSADLGRVRRSSAALENEPSGVRPGVLPRVVLPVGVRRQRGIPM